MKLFIFVIVLITIKSSFSNKCEPCPADCKHGTIEIKGKTDSSCKCVCAPNLCEEKLCPPETTCHIRHDQCVGKSCNHHRTAVCVENNKKGTCPSHELSSEAKAPNYKGCKLDSDCHGENKCCKTVCTKPCPTVSCKCSANMKVSQEINAKGCPTCQCVDTAELANKKAKDLKDPCQQPKFEGPCRAIFTRYYYDAVHKKCSNFTYGGCQGNENNFLKQADCEIKCINKETDIKASPDNKKASLDNKKTSLDNKVTENSKCLQEKKVGPCKAAFEKYFYNANTKKCENFTYGGCQGNDNNFKNKEDCERECGVSSITEIDACSQEKKIGPCFAAIPKFYYDKKAKKCEKFIYGGCQGNENNFEKIEDCEKRCISPKTPVAPKIAVINDKCLQEKVVGPCKAAFEKYHYNPASKMCEKFIYGGCQGNDNNFKNKEDCEKLCGVTEDTDICSQEKKVGPCMAALPRYYYNKDKKECEKFIFGGCQENENNFFDLAECEKKCGSKKMDTKDNKVTDEKVLDKCSQPKKVGPCKAALPRFFYNKDKHACELFKFGGCQENENNFAKKEDCEKECVSKKLPADTKENKELNTKDNIDKCSQEKKVGPCKALVPRFFYNKDNKTCESFYFGGCQGNDNNFHLKEDCERECVPKSVIDPCTLKSDTGVCRANKQRFFYNQKTKECEIFTYGGCQGNANNFETKEACQKKCASPKKSNFSEKSKKCSLAKDSGPCKAAFKKYFFNKDENKCEEFFYGGCKGNENRFESKEACIKECI